MSSRVPVSQLPLPLGLDTPYNSPSQTWEPGQDELVLQLGMRLPGGKAGATPCMGAMEESFLAACSCMKLVSVGSQAKIGNLKCFRLLYLRTDGEELETWRKWKNVCAVTSPD